MNSKHLKKIVAAAVVSLLPLAGCSLTKEEGVTKPKSSLPQSGNPADQVGIPGVPGASVPTSRAVTLRISNGLKNNAVPTAGNFSRAISQLGSNLPEDTNPNRATGYDQVPLLAYAACSDVPLSAYNIPGAGSGTGTVITNARSALIAAGVNIVDQHTGGLGSTGPLASQVAALFGQLVDDNAKISGETLTMEFVSVCMTASTFGATMLGF